MWIRLPDIKFITIKLTHKEFIHKPTRQWLPKQKINLMVKVVFFIDWLYSMKLMFLLNYIQNQFIYSLWYHTIFMALKY